MRLMICIGFRLPEPGVMPTTRISVCMRRTLKTHGGSEHASLRLGATQRDPSPIMLHEGAADSVLV